MKTITPSSFYTCIVLCVLLLSTGKSFAQCEHYFFTSRISPSGPVCSAQNVTLRAEYGLSGAPFYGQFRWYTSQDAPSPVFTTTVQDGLLTYSDYSFFATQSTTMWVSYYDNYTGCETFRADCIINITGMPEMNQQYGWSCGNGIAQLQVSSNVSDVTFELYKLNPGIGYHFLGSNKTGFFQITDFLEAENLRYYVRLYNPAGCTSENYYLLGFVMHAPSEGGVTRSVNTGQVNNTVLTSDFGATTLSSNVGNVIAWEYSYLGPGSGYSNWGQAGQTTTSGTCCIGAPGQTIWIRALVQNESCAVDRSDPTSYYWQPRPPVVTIGPDVFLTLPNNSFTLTAQATDPDDAIVSYTWTKISGPQITLSGLNTSQLSASGAYPGVYRFAVAVRDNYGLTTTDEVDVTVHNPPPVANAGPDLTVYKSDNQLVITGTATDADGSITEYQWTKLSGPTIGFTDPGNGVLVLNGLRAGVFVFRLSVKDNFNATAYDDVVITVTMPPNNYNWIKETTVLVDHKKTATDIASLSIVDGQKAVNYSYFDGLGRSMQTVAVQGSPGKKDIVNPVLYDDLGRQSASYLPFTAETNGYFKRHDEIISPSTGDYTGIAASFYNNAGNMIADDGNEPYAETMFEPSPLNRVIKQGAPGTAWQPDGDHTYASGDATVKFSYELNAANEVIQWTYVYPDANNPVGRVGVGTTTHYAAKKLYRNKRKDEHGSEVIEYTDNQGRLILKKIQVNNTGIYTQTYYIYDDLGNLITVLPPEAVKKMEAIIIEN